MNITAENAASLLEDVEVRASLDTVEIFYHRPPKGVRIRLQAAQGRRIAIKDCRDKTGMRQGVRIVLNRPTKAALEEVGAVLRDFPSGCIRRCDLAFDFHSAPDVSEKLATLIDEHLILKWRARRAIKVRIDTTTYWAMKCRGRNVAQYRKKDDVLRVELRFLNAASVKRAGLADPSLLAALNPAILADRNFRLRILKQAWVEKCVRRAVNRDRINHLNKRLISNAARGRTHPIHDRYRARIPVRIRHLLSKIDMQNFVTTKTVRFTDIVPLSVLRIPVSLAWPKQPRP